MMTIARVAMSSPLIQNLSQNRHHNWNNNLNRSRHLNNSRNNNLNRRLNRGRLPEFRSKKTSYPSSKRVVRLKDAMLTRTQGWGSIWRRTQALRKVALAVPCLTLGIVREVRLFGGLMAGVAGAHLSLVHTGTFAENMSAGKGFIAIAVVVLGRWSPKGVVAAALFFGGAEALQFALQAVDADLPYPLFLALPYVLSLAALAGWFGRSRAPAGLGSAWPRR